MRTLIVEVEIKTTKQVFITVEKDVFARLHNPKTNKVELNGDAYYCAKLASDACEEVNANILEDFIFQRALSIESFDRDGLIYEYEGGEDSY